MMRLSVILMALLFCGSAGAQQKTREQILEQCEVASELSSSVMQARQLGAPIAEMMKAASGNRWLENVVKSAYEFDLLSTREGKRIVAVEFGNAYYLSCLQQLSE